jgi:hypothetical protein
VWVTSFAIWTSADSLSKCECYFVVV